MYRTTTIYLLLYYLAPTLVDGRGTREDYYVQKWPEERMFKDNGTTPLYIGLMMSFGGDFDSSSGVPGVQVALNQINSDPSMLPGYTLHYTLTDSQVRLYTATSYTKVKRTVCSGVARPWHMYARSCARVRFASATRYKTNTESSNMAQLQKRKRLSLSDCCVPSVAMKKTESD